MVTLLANNIPTGRKKEGRNPKTRPKTTKGGRNMRSQPNHSRLHKIGAWTIQKVPEQQNFLQGRL